MTWGMISYWYPCRTSSYPAWQCFFWSSLRFFVSAVPGIKSCLPCSDPPECGLSHSYRASWYLWCCWPAASGAWPTQDLYWRNCLPQSPCHLPLPWPRSWTRPGFLLPLNQARDRPRPSALNPPPASAHPPTERLPVFCPVYPRRRQCVPLFPLESDPGLTVPTRRQ